GGGLRLADSGAVETFDRHDARAGAGGERLVGTVDVVGCEIALDHWDPHDAVQGKERGPRNSAEHGAVGRSAELAVRYKEEIAEMGFADVTVEVEHQRRGAGIDLPGLEGRNRMVDLVGDLGLGLEALRRR